MTEFISAFHFLRPWWLLALPVVVLLYLLNVKNRRENDPISTTFAPHLLPFLLVPEPGKNRFRPNQLLLIVWLLAVLALAGPAWQREPSPFAEDQAPLVIVLKNTPSMLAKDIQPSRLERSTHKIKDLCVLRAGGLTALVTYAGSSHLVMPLTRDSSVIEIFAAELTPAIMPKEGDAVADALLLAADVLNKAGSGGSILLISDSLSEEQQPSLREAAENLGGYPITVLAMAAPPGSPAFEGSQDVLPLDVNTLKDSADLIDATVVTVTPDTADVEAVNGHIEHDHQLQLSENEDERWRDMGYAFLPLLALLSLCWGRKGWYVKWEEKG